MAAPYEPVGHLDHPHPTMNNDTQHEGKERISSLSPFPGHGHVDSASPLSNTTSNSASVTMASPSSSAYLTLADQTFTPLSMDTTSDYYSSDLDDGRNNFGSMMESMGMGIARGNSASEVDQPQRKILRSTRSTKELRRKFEAGEIGKNAVAGSGTDSAEGQAQRQAQALVTPQSRNGVPIVSTMVQNYEALQPALTVPIGYDINDLIATKNKLDRKNHILNHNIALGLVSPPSTLSPSPSLSPSPVAHKFDASQTGFTRVLNTSSPTRDIVVTANYGYAPDGPGPDTAVGPPAPQQHEGNPAGQDNSSNSNQEKLSSFQFQPVSQDPSTPPDASRASYTCSTTDANSKASALPALTIPPINTTSAVTDFAVSSVSVDTAIARPTAERPPISHTPRSGSPSPTNPLFRSPSNSSVALSHPTPDSAKRARSGAHLGNIAALEATAERLSLASSFDLAIREELDELKRSDSRRSSILQASQARSVSGSDSASVQGQPQSSAVSRQNSILGTNTVARLGGYSPGGFIMSPPASVAGAPLRLRSSSKASSFNVPAHIAGSVHSIDNGGGEENLFMSRHGPGKSSVRSVASRASLGLITELDKPTALTKEAFDEADRVAAIGEEMEDDDTIRASAHQHIEAEFADILADASSPQTQVLLPALDNGLMDLPSPRLQIHQPADYQPYEENLAVQDDRPTTSGSNMTYEAQRAFGDFDGVHCDPELSEFPPPQAPQFQEPAPALPSPRHLGPPPPRPKSYFDPSTGQQMLFYPAPVPAMLNLPPKLSKKPKGAIAARNIRRSQILSAMPQAMPQEPPRESRIWLPDPMEGLQGNREEPFMTGLLGDDLGSAPAGADQAPQLPDAGATGHHLGEPSSHARQASEASTIHAPLPSPQHGQHEQEQQLQIPQPQQREIRRPQRLTEADKRRTRATMLDELPPHLRASAFFDLPPVLPQVEVKGGSAMATLDSILDASAHAPVSAFTDHAFAGKLGSEVYGPEKKKKKKKAKAADGQDGAEKRKTIVPKTSTGDLINEPRKPNKLRKRASQMSLMGIDTEQDDDAVDGRTTLGLVGGEEGAARRTANLGGGTSPHSYQEPFSPNQLAPDSDENSEEDSEEEESSDEDDVYQGPPTTLLAELQLRKQQNAMRTRPKYNAYSNGLHTTLLELDAVAEVERKARKGKRVNLAWEDPTMNPDHLEDLDDDEVPLGMLYVAKAAGNTPSTMDITAVINEVNRPLGLMERRELEDNEPLSQRRERLQGGGGGMLAPMSLAMMQKRMTALQPPGATGGGLRSMSRLALPLQGGGSVMGGSAAGSVVGDADPEDAEFEGETLAQRKARLAAENPLPRARPVSGMFSAELLSQFGGEEDGGSKDGSSKDGKKSPDGNVPEEEETLGQRRKRLQAEREAREREMNAGGGPGMLGVGQPNANRNTMLSMAPSGMGMGAAGGGLDVPVSASRLSHRLSMSDVLNAHPIDTPQGMLDPRTQDRLKREAEADRAQREMDAKMAALRAQMPTSMERPTHGARTGGYMGGRFNDGSGGLPGQQQRLPSMTMGMGVPVPPAVGYGGGVGYAAPGQQYARASTMYAAPAPGPGNGVYGAAPGGMGYGSSMQLPMQTTYPIMGGGVVPGQQGQPVDMVERWRQSVMP